MHRHRINVQVVTLLTIVLRAQSFVFQRWKPHSNLDLNVDRERDRSTIPNISHLTHSTSKETRKHGARHHMFPGPESPFPDELLTRSEAIARSLALPLALAASFRVGAALSVIGQPRMPPIQPTPEGTKDTERTFPNIGSQVVRLDGTGTRLRLFYPCMESWSLPRDEHYCTDGRATSDGMAGLVGFRQLGLSFLLAHLAMAKSGCTAQGTPVNSESFPLLIYSHGYGGNMDMAAYFLRTIASRGVLVAALEHSDGTASSTVLPNGDRLDFSPSLYSSRRSLQRRADEMVCALAEVPGSIAENLGLQIDKSKIFMGGHSYGAPSVLLATQELASDFRQPAVAGLILHDPALGMGYNLLQLPPRLPTISYTSDEYNRGGVQCGDLTLHVRGAYHGNFVDAPLWAPLWVMRTLSLLIPACGPADPNQVHNELARSAASFFRSCTSSSGSSRALSREQFESVSRPTGELSLLEVVS